MWFSSLAINVTIGLSGTYGAPSLVRADVAQAEDHLAAHLVFVQVRKVYKKAEAVRLNDDPGVLAGMVFIFPGRDSIVAPRPIQIDLKEMTARRSNRSVRCERLPHRVDVRIDFLSEAG
jgi:hypothetical protein